METSAEFQSPQDEQVQAAPETAVAPEPPAPIETEYGLQVWRELSRATQGWIQWGTLGFAVFCIVVGAVEALFGR